MNYSVSFQTTDLINNSIRLMNISEANCNLSIKETHSENEYHMVWESDSINLKDIVFELSAMFPDMSIDRSLKVRLGWEVDENISTTNLDYEFRLYDAITSEMEAVEMDFIDEAFDIAINREIREIEEVELSEIFSL